jgi:formylglycine-generating enzyme required for sulfatase activity
MKAKRLDPIVPDAPQAEALSRPSLTGAERTLLRAQVDLIEAKATELSAIVDTNLTLADTWVDRHLIRCEPSATRPPLDDGETVGLALDHLLKESAPLISAVIGPSGSGKSACCRMLAAKASLAYQNDSRTMYPVYLEAARLDLDPAHDPTSSIAAASLLSLGQDQGLREQIVESLRTLDEQVILIVDGLDRLPANQQANHTGAFLTLLKRFRSSRTQSHVVLGCREEMWFDAGCYPLRNLATAFKLRAFSLVDIKAYLDLWHRQTGRVDGPSPSDLMMSIIADVRLRSLLRQPFMLGLSAYVVEKTGAWPRGTGGLCEELVDTCLNRIDRIASGRVTRRLEYQGELLAVLELMAWRLTAPQEKAENGRVLTPAAVRDCVLQVLQGTGSGDRRSVMRAASGAMDFLELFHAGTGLFCEVGANEFGFSDDAFRLFFAGRHLAGGARRDLLDALDEPELPAADAVVVWAEGRAHRHEIDTVLLLVEDLVESPIVAHRLMAGRLLDPVYRTGVTRRHDWFARWEGKVRDVLCEIRGARRVGLRARALAGDALAEIGDPLLQEHAERAVFLEVPGGLRKIGSEDKPEFEDDKYALIHWHPPFACEIGPFRMAVHPVTNHAYEQFIRDGGYAALELWESPEARAWVTGDETGLGRFAELVQSSLGLHYKKDIEAGFMSVVDYESMREEFVDRLLRRAEPLHWLDPRFSRPNQPVVGVNFWEACAFCCWLTRRLRQAGLLSAGEVCRLPSEMEWEQAAARAGDRYPWGSEWDEASAHVRCAAWIAEAVSIGTFPWAASPCGCHDMIGNVWDWTLSAAVPYARNRPVPMATGVENRITRGGSWLAKLPETRRVEFRSYDPPCNAYADLGFRPVIAAQATR